MLSKMSEEWWSRAVIYQIWPYSYKNSTTSGYGDLQGMIDQLDYVKMLGADAIWVSPIFKSPGKDKGYDVSDYREINPLFGDIKTAEKFIEEAHKRKIRVLFDMVVNHTSEEHHWFQSAKNDINSPYRDYYIFHKGRGNGQPPNNWQSFFSGSSWTYNQPTDDYYLHLFDSSQPDINWKNPKLRQEIFDIVKFWMDKGVDGWRVDALAFINKNPNVYKDEIPDGDNSYRIDEQLHDYIKELCAVIRSYEGAIIIGELGDTGDSLSKFTDPDRKELTGAILFHVMDIDFDYSQGISKFAIIGFNMKNLHDALNKWYTNIQKGCIALHIQSHDQPRIVSRWGNDSDPILHNKSGKMLAIFNHLLKGLPIIYQGEEIGMTNWAFNMDQVDDVAIKNAYQELVVEKHIFTEEEFIKRARYFSRDNSRTPLQWDSSENAGFTKGKPWLPVNDNYKTINFKNAISDKDSIFYFYKSLIQLRKTEDLLVKGNFCLAINNDEHVLGYLRYQGKDSLLVICNFSADKKRIKLEDIGFDFAQPFELLIYNYREIVVTEGELILEPYESFVVKGKTL